MRWLFAAAISSLLFAAVASSTFVPLRDAGGIHYLFAWPGLSVLAAVWTAAMTAGVGVYLIVLRRARLTNESTAALARDGQWLAPLVGLGFAIIGILPAVPGIGERAAPLAYFFFDLRWSWFALLVGWTLVRAESLIGSPIAHRLAATRRWAPETRLLAMDAVVFAGVITWAIVTTPHLRFSGMLHGDEPKYIRYCEIWYQGGGLDISGKALVADEPLDSSPHLTQAALQLPRTIVEESRELASDLGRFASHPLTFRWNRAKGGNGFVQGKHGGIYQIYQPGLSAVLFPGYVLDRYLFGLHPGYQGEFPEELVMTNLTMLLVYGLCAVSLFRLLRNLMASDSLAMFWAVIGVLILPAGAFSFQFYPELPALLIILVLSNFLLVRASNTGALISLVSGAAAGALCWMHPRFLLLSLAIAIVGIARTTAVARRAFVGGYAVVLLSVMAFAYRVTGSWLPTALWDAATTGGPINPLAVPLNLVGYLFHRTWGLLPHALLLVAVTPGLVILARTRPSLVGILLVFALCLGIPAAGHTLSAAAGTPGRLVLAVIPLFVWPVATVIRRFWSYAAVRSAAAILVVLSLDAALAYNWTHQKLFGPMRGAAMSGWKPNLMFPDVYATSSQMSASHVVVLVGWLAFIALLSFIAYKWDATPETRPRGTSWPVALRHAVVPAGVVAIAFLTTATIGRWSFADYLPDDRDAHRLAARALVALDRCRVCFTSQDGAIDWTTLNPNRAEAMTIAVAPGPRSLGLQVRLVGDDDRFARFGRIHIDFGDGHSTPWSGIVDEEAFEHQYGEPGTYSVVTWLQLRNGHTRLDRRTVTIGGAQSGG